MHNPIPRRSFTLLAAAAFAALYAAPAAAQIGGLGHAVGPAAGRLHADAAPRGDAPPVFLPQVPR